MSDNKNIWFVIFKPINFMSPFLAYIPTILSVEVIKMDENKLTYRYLPWWRVGNKIESIYIKPMLEIKKIITKIYDDKSFEEKKYIDKIISFIKQLDNESPLIETLFEVREIVDESYTGGFLKRFSIPFNSCKEAVNFCEKVIDINKENIYLQFKGVIDNEQ